MSLSGLTPASLAALLGAVSLAVVLLYLLRLRRRTLVVPHVALWEGLGEESRRPALWRRLRRWLSLLLQWAIAALMVFALADPRPDGAGGCSGNTPLVELKHHVIVVDTSLSMGAMEEGRSRLSQGIDFAHKRVDELLDAEDGILILLESHGQTRPLTLWTRERGPLHDALDALDARGVRHTASSSGDLLTTLRPLLTGRARAEVTLFSDGTLELPDEIELPSGPVPLTHARVGRAVDNVGIVAFNVRPHLGDRLGHSVLLTLRNESERAVDAEKVANAPAVKISSADRVVCLEQGRVVETGTHGMVRGPGP